MHRTRIAAVVGLVTGGALLVALAGRIGLYWVVDPLNDLLAVGAGLLLAAGLALGAVSLPALRGRAFRTAAALATAGAVLIGAVELIVELPRAAGSGLVSYGPGTPPSISWSLLAGQVAGPVLASAGVALLAAALLAAILGLARAVGRLRTT